jgi:hypothetical protein
MYNWSGRGLRFGCRRNTIDVEGILRDDTESSKNAWPIVVWYCFSSVYLPYVEKMVVYCGLPTIAGPRSDPYVPLGRGEGHSRMQANIIGSINIRGRVDEEVQPLTCSDTFDDAS